MEENSDFNLENPQPTTTRESNLNVTQTSDCHECEGKVELCKSSSCVKCFHEDNCDCTPCQLVSKGCKTYEKYLFCSDHPDDPAECGLCQQQRKIEYYKYYRNLTRDKNDKLKAENEGFRKHYGDDEDYTEEWKFVFREKVEFSFHTAMVNKVSQDYKEREERLRADCVKECEEIKKKEEANSKDNLMKALFHFTRPDSTNDIKSNKIGELTVDETVSQLLKTLKTQQDRIDDLESEFVEKFNHNKNETIKKQKEIYSTKTEYLQNEIDNLTEKHENEVKTLKLEVAKSKKVLADNKKLISQNKKKRQKLENLYKNNCLQLDSFKIRVNQAHSLNNSQNSDSLTVGSIRPENPNSNVGSPESMIDDSNETIKGRVRETPKYPKPDYFERDTHTGLRINATKQICPYTKEEIFLTDSDDRNMVEEGKEFMDKNAAHFLNAFDLVFKNT